MSRDELIEKMARAMLNWVEPAGFKPWGIERDVAKATAALTALENAGMAMRSDVLEEAAKVAEYRYQQWRMPHKDDAMPGEVCCDVSSCEDIAAAIRALAARPVRTEEKE